MRGKLTIILTSLVGGLVGGAISRGVIPEASVFAQSQNQAAKIVRAERIELVNKQGKALAVLEVGYANALPAGAPVLTFTDRDELLHQENKLTLTTARLQWNSGDDSATLSPTGFTFHNSSKSSGGGIGPVPPTDRPGIYFFSPEGVTTLDGVRLNIADKEGRSRAALP